MGRRPARAEMPRSCQRATIPPSTGKAWPVMNPAPFKHSQTTMSGIPRPRPAPQPSGRDRYRPDAPKQPPICRGADRLETIDMTLDVNDRDVQQAGALSPVYNVVINGSSMVIEIHWGAWWNCRRRLGAGHEKAPLDRTRTSAWEVFWRSGIGAFRAFRSDLHTSVGRVQPGCRSIDLRGFLVIAPATGKA